MWIPARSSSDLPPALTDLSAIRRSGGADRTALHAQRYLTVEGENLVGVDLTLTATDGTSQDLEICTPGSQRLIAASGSHDLAARGEADAVDTALAWSAAGVA